MNGGYSSPIMRSPLIQRKSKILNRGKLVCLDVNFNVLISCDLESSQLSSQSQDYHLSDKVSEMLSLSAHKAGGTGSARTPDKTLTVSNINVLDGLSQECLEDLMLIQQTTTE
jgi:hypothetical protein